MYTKLMAIAMVTVLAVGTFIATSGEEGMAGTNGNVTYTVTFDGNGGQPNLASKTVVYGQPYGKLPSGVWAHHEFYYWNTECHGYGETITSDTVYDTKGDITLYAIWLYDFRISYDLMNPLAQNDPNNPTYYNKLQSLTFRDATMPGGTFDGWYMNGNYDPPRIEHLDAGEIYGDFTLYAKWK